MSEKEKWVIPEWMEMYTELILNSGGVSIEDAMNRLRFDKHLILANMVAYAICCEVSAQVNLLTRLYNEGIID